jgi:hypothetical protein
MSNNEVTRGVRDLIRNIASQAGELDVHFATPENLDVQARAEQRELREPILGNYEGLLSDMSNMFHGQMLEPEHLDETGRHPKLTMKAECEYLARSMDAGDGIPIDHCFSKAVFMNLSVPDKADVSVEYGSCPSYPTPAIAEADFALRGGFQDRSGQKDFMNRFSLLNSTYMTAAAMEMALLYIDHFILPRLRGQEVGFVAPAVAEVDHRANILDTQTSMLPSELTSHHSLQVLCLAHKALQANTVLGLVDFEPGTSRVFNKCGNLPRTVVNEEIFWETWHLLRHTATGSKESSQWECDFMMVFIQNFSLHSLSDEGGVWRKIFKKYMIMPNACVVTSKFRPNTIGFYNVNDKMLMGTCATMQSLVSRALFEMRVDNRKFMLGPNPTPSEVATVIHMCRVSIIECFTQATNLPPDYWEDFIRLGSHEDLARDRHVVGDQAKFLKNFSPFMTTYSVGLPGTKLGANSYDPLLSKPLRFKGAYGVNKVMQDNMLMYTLDMQDDMLFDNGLFYLNPKVNRDDGLMELVHNGAYTGTNQPLEDVTRLVDGRDFSYGQAIAEVIWRDNRDVVPTSGDLRSIYATTVLLQGDTVPDWATKGNYQVSVGRYSFLRKMKGESRSQGKTRMDEFIKRRGDSYPDPYGKDRPKITNPVQYYRRYHNFSRKKAEGIVKNQEELEKRARRELFNSDDKLDEQQLDVKAEAIKLHVEGLASKIGQVSSSVKASQESNKIVASKKAVEAWIDLEKIFGDSGFVMVSQDEASKWVAQMQGDTDNRYVYGQGDSSRKWNEDVYLGELETLRAKVDVIRNTLLAEIHTYTGALGGDRIDAIQDAVYDMEKSKRYAAIRIEDPTAYRPKGKPRILIQEVQKVETSLRSKPKQVSPPTKVENTGVGSEQGGDKERIKAGGEIESPPAPQAKSKKEEGKEGQDILSSQGKDGKHDTSEVAERGGDIVQYTKEQQGEDSPESGAPTAIGDEVAEGSGEETQTTPPSDQSLDEEDDGTGDQDTSAVLE